MPVKGRQPAVKPCRWPIRPVWARPHNHMIQTRPHHGAATGDLLISGEA